MDSENDTESPFPPPSSPSSSPSSCKRKAGRTKFKETSRHHIYRGIRRRNGDKWVREVREPNQKSRIWLGTYPTPEMAATAHDAAVLSLRGSSALLNFPDFAPLLPLATTSSPSDIRAAATLLRPYPIISPSSSSSPHDKTNKSVEDSSMMSSERSKNNIVKNEEFVDEEALYNMPALLDSMAEGLLLPPPSMIRASDDNIPSSHDVDLNLWAH